MLPGLPARMAVVVAAVLLSIWVLIPTFMGKEAQERLEDAAARAKDEDLPPPETPDPWWVSVLPNRKVILGLDLQGGIDLTLDVETEEAVLSTIHRDVVPVKEAAEKVGVKLADVRRDHHGPNLLVFPAEGTDLAAVQELMRKSFGAYEYVSTRDVEGRNAFVYTMREDQQGEIAQNAVTQALETIRSRIDETGVKEPSITKKGDRGIGLQLPGETNVDQAIAALSTTAQLEFMLVDEEADRDRAIEGVKAAAAELPPEDFADDELLSEWLADHGHIDDNRKLLWEYHKVEGTKKRLSDADLGAVPHIFRESGSPYLLKDEVLLTGDDVNDAQTRPDDRSGGWDVALEFKPRGQARFADITGANVKKRFAIILDDEVRSAPVIQERINGVASISMGSGSIEEQAAEASNLALVLRSGALPAPVSVGEVRTVGASLGERAINEGMIATAVGCALVFLLTGVYYRVSGLLADFALALNVFLVMALLATVGATLTLPGICGIALTVGMAVDASIIIFERIREELRAGKPARAAIDAGFDRASVAVIDANICTLLAGVVLYSYGSGPLKGFAATLMIGIFTTLFCGVFVSRTLMDLVFSGRRATVSI